MESRAFKPENMVNICACTKAYRALRLLVNKLIVRCANYDNDSANVYQSVLLKERRLTRYTHWCRHADLRREIRLLSITGDRKAVPYIVIRKMLTVIS